MYAHSSLVYLLFLLVFASYQVTATVALDDDVVAKLETDLFDLNSTLKDEVVTETREEEEDEEEFIEDLGEGGNRRDVLVPAG